jgi:peptidoglycan/LPS O-acetylase OafA/YrhL
VFRIVDTNSNNFDFIRLFVAALVIFSHSFILTAGTNAGEPLATITHGHETWGDLAVDVFFLISGYLVTASYTRSRTLWAYLKKRISRIFPGFMLATLVTLFAVTTVTSARLDGATRLSQANHAILKAMTLRDLDWVGAFSSNPYPQVVNGSLWTIHFEFSCYVLLAIAGMCGVLRCRRVCLALFALSFAVRIAFGVWHSSQIAALHEGEIAHGVRFIPLFLAGATCYLYRDKLTFRLSFAMLATVILAAATQVPDGLSCLFPAAGTYLVLFLAYHPAIRMSRFGHFGDFSFGTYLYGCPIQQFLVWMAHGHLNPYMLFLLATPMAIIAGAISWHLAEKWFLLRSRPAQKQHQARNSRMQPIPSA